MYGNILYFDNINKIGGVESFFYYLAKKYQNLDITILYSTADPVQLARLKKIVRVKQYVGQKIKCKKAFFNYNLKPINNIEAEEYYEIIHADYKTLGYKPNVHPKINHYLGVSQLVCDSFQQLTGIKCELVYNPIVLEKPKKILKLISATRLTKEKGKNRIITLAKALDDAAIPYIWTIYTNDINAIDNPNIIYREPQLDISSYIADADYLVQLSDAEGYGYSPVEALMLGIPVIVTDLPVFKELGFDETNSIKLPLDMKNIPIEKIYEHNFNFKYTPKEDSWGKILYLGKSTYQDELNTEYEVEALRIYQEENIRDNQLGRIPKTGEHWKVTKERLDILRGENKYNKNFVKLIKEHKKTSI